MTRWSVVLLALVGARGVGAEVSSDQPAAVLLFPRVVADSSIGVDTLIRLSNTNTTSPLTVHCFLVDASPLCPNDSTRTCLKDSAASQCTVPCVDRWSETDFRLILTTRQPIGWLISQGMRDCRSNPASDPDRPCFQLDGVVRTGPGGQNNAGSNILPAPHDQFIGYLQCIAVDDNDAPLERNDLKGEATIVRDTRTATPVKVCTAGTAITTGMTCTADSDCTSTGACDTMNNVCENSLHSCTQDSDCGKCIDPQGQQCIVGIVGAPCASDSDCNADFGVCTSMLCTSNPGKSCTTSPDCKVAGMCGAPMTKVCSAGATGAACTQDGTCAVAGECGPSGCIVGALGKACTGMGADSTCDLTGKCGLTAPTITQSVDVDGYNAVGLQAITTKQCQNGTACNTSADCAGVGNGTCATPNDHDFNLCLGGCTPGQGTCSVTRSQSCFNNNDCPTKETCADKCPASDVCPVGPEYDGCANILLLDHFLDGATDPISGLSVVTDLTLVPCTQDYLRQNPNKTTVQFLIFNEFEQRFSTSTPVTCFKEFRLSNIDTNTNIKSIFSAAVNGTLTGQTRIRGVALDDPTHGDTLIGMAREFRCGPGSTLAACNVVSTAAFNLHSQGRRPEVDLIYLPPS
ncbi:MAG TPA: hypothetical protein VL403_12040 [Candidatus Kryptonia bacterium]|nr:hypothetical protein [Candidatus Kryptonia bacterium]